MTKTGISYFVLHELLFIYRDDFVWFVDVYKLPEACFPDWLIPYTRIIYK